MKRNNVLRMNSRVFSGIIAIIFTLVLVQGAFALSIAGTISANYGSEFLLLQGQTAQIYEGTPKVEIRAVTVYVPGEIEAAVPSATLDVSLVNENGSTSERVTILEGEEKTVLGSLKIKATDFEPQGEDLGAGSLPAGVRLVVTTEGETQPDDISVNLGQDFSLVSGQKAEIVGEDLELRLGSIFYAFAYGPCASGAECPQNSINKPYAQLTIAKNSSDGTATATEIMVFAGYKAEVFGYTVETLNVSPNSVSFKVTKTSEPPSGLTVKLREAFYLKTGQSAQVVNDDGRKVVRLSLDKIIFDQVQCFKAPCPPFRYAYVSYSFSGGGTQSMKIQEGETLSLKPYSSDSEYQLALVTLSDTQGYFIVQKKSTSNPEEISVSLDEEFKLSQKQTAVVKETGLRMTFDGITQTMCQPGSGQSGSGNCRTYASFSVSSDVVYGLLQAAGQESSNAPILTSRASSGQIIYLAEGESTSAFGHKISLNKLSYPGDGKYVAYLVISKESSPDSIRVKLNEKFELSKNQSASVVDNGQELVKVRLYDIYEWDENYCVPGKDYKCDNRRVAYLEVQPFNHATGTSLRLREGDSRIVGEFSVSLLDIDNGRAVLLVKRAVPEGRYIKVSLGEEFKLETGDTALVVDNGLFIRLEQVYVLKSLPPQYVASVSVWQNYKNESSTRTTYKLSEKESIELYGVNISFLEGSSDTAKFVVKAESDQGVINVNVDEPFWLLENQAARVVQANLRIDLLDLGFYQKPCIQGETCTTQEMATISVSHFFGPEKGIAKRLSETAASQVVVSSTSVQADSATNESLIDLPPVPFQTYELFAGQEVTVNDFTIKLLSISGGKAEFLVRGKPSDFTVKFEIERGWNLFSLPGEIEAADASCSSSEWKIFEFNKEANKFERVQKPVSGHAYWVYNPGEKCSAKASLRNPVRLSELATLLPGWNFVPLTVDMVGQKINELGDCKVRVAYEWNANSRKWQKVTTQTISRDDLGKAWAVYTNNKCRFDNAVEVPGDAQPPALPPVEDGKVWMKMSPVQCQGNPWEMWYAGLYPNEQLPSEEDLIVKYFAVVHKIDVLDYQQFDSDLPVCSACDCKRGDTIRVLVYDSDAKVLEGLGFGFSDRG